MNMQEFQRMSTEERRSYWSAIEADLKAHLHDHASLFETFRAQMEQVFTAMLKAKGHETFTRKPNISLRLIVDGSPTAKLIVLPKWMGRSKRVDCSEVHCEYLVEVHRLIEGQTETNWRIAMSAWFTADQGHMSRTGMSAREDMQRVTDTVRAFVTDARAILARSHDACCICGRPLTDELSRARGTGPECIRIAPFQWFVGDGSPMAPLQRLVKAETSAEGEEADLIPSSVANGVPLRQGTLF